MLSWFEKRAPIRTKFKALLLVYLIEAGVIAAAAGYATAHATGIDGRLVIACAAAGVVAIAITTIVASRLICTPYVATVVRMEALAAGDLTSPIAYTDNADCVGRLTKAMASFRRNSEEAMVAGAQRSMALAMGEGLARLAAGDLTHRIEADLTGPFATLKTDFNAAVTALQQAMSAVACCTGGIHTGAGEIRCASDNLSQRTEQQAASLEQTAAAMDEITTAVRKTAEDAGRANGVVGEARSDAEHSGEVVRRAVGAMGDIERASEEIGEIIAVIDGIAFQTNLLALNAGVEAARAGDAGKGFAVVASEVRALAQRSADAAKDVKTKILSSSHQVSNGVELVGETGRVLQRIMGRFATISELVHDIAVAAEHQSSGLREVNTAVSEMDSVTQQNAAMVEEATAAARSLAAEADELAHQVGRFNTGDTAVAGRGREDTRPVVHQMRDQVAARIGSIRPAPAVEEASWAAF